MGENACPTWTGRQSRKARVRSLHPNPGGVVAASDHTRPASRTSRTTNATNRPMSRYETKTTKAVSKLNGQRLKSFPETLRTSLSDIDLFLPVSKPAVIPVKRKHLHEFSALSSFAELSSCSPKGPLGVVTALTRDYSLFASRESTQKNSATCAAIASRYHIEA